MCYNTLNSMVKRSLFILFLIGIVFLFAYFLLHNSDKKINGLLSLSGRIEARETFISPKIQGRIINIYKDDGDKVKEGELLIELESEQINARYKTALENSKSASYALMVNEAILKKAKATYEKAKNDFERYSSLIKEDLVSKSDFDRVKMNYELSQAEVEASLKSLYQSDANHKASLSRLMEAEAELRELKIYSPLDGVVLSRNVEKGEVVNQGNSLFVIIDPNRVYVKVYVPEPEIGKLKLGLPARVYIDAYPDKYFNGKITKIYEQAEFTPKNVETKEERVKLVFGVEVSLENPEGLLKPGMPADVVIKWKEDAPWIKPR